MNPPDSSPKITPMKYGYARVSTQEQSLDVQLDALKLYGCDQIFSEKLSGSSTKRPALNKLLKMLQPHDTIVIHRLDRLGRSLCQLVDLMRIFEQRKICFVCLTDAFDTSTPTGRLLYHVLASIAHFERDLIRSRTKLALAAAKRRGVTIGRPKGIMPKTKAKVLACASLVEQGRSINRACLEVGISKPTYFKYRSCISNTK